MLTEMIDRNGNVTKFSYNSGWQLETIRDTFGRTVSFAYAYYPDYDASVLDSITDWTGRTWDATVDPVTRRLISLEDPASNVTTYGYGFGGDDRLLVVDEPGPRAIHIDGAAFPDNGLTISIKDNGNTVSTWSITAYRTVGGGYAIGGGGVTNWVLDSRGNAIHEANNT